MSTKIDHYKFDFGPYQVAVQHDAPTVQQVIVYQEALNKEIDRINASDVSDQQKRIEAYVEIREFIARARCILEFGGATPETRMDLIQYLMETEDPLDKNLREKLLISGIEDQERANESVKIRATKLNPSTKRRKEILT